MEYDDQSSRYYDSNTSIIIYYLFNPYNVMAISSGWVMFIITLVVCIVVIVMLVCGLRSVTKKNLRWSSLVGTSNITSMSIENSEPLRIDEQVTDCGTHQSHIVIAEDEDITAATEQTEVAKCTATNIHQTIESELMKMTECAAYGTHQPKDEFMKMTECAAYSTHQPKQSDHELMRMTECAAYGTHQPKDELMKMSKCAAYGTRTHQSTKPEKLNKAEGATCIKMHSPANGE